MKKNHKLLYMTLAKIVGGDGFNFNIFFRYAMILFLYMIAFIYIFNNSSQFILFICIFILNFFGGIFILRDIFTNPVLLTKVSYGVSDMNIKEDDPIYLKIFLFTICVGFISQFVSLILLFVVFTYGMPNSNDFSVYQMSSDTIQLLYKYKIAFIVSTSLLCLLGFFILYRYLSIEIQNVMRNLLCIGFTLGILGLTSYEMYLAVEFLKIKQKHMRLYQIVS